MDEKTIETLEKYCSISKRNPKALFKIKSTGSFVNIIALLAVEGNPMFGVAYPDDDEGFMVDPNDLVEHNAVVMPLKKVIKPVSRPTPPTNRGPEPLNGA